MVPVAIDYEKLKNVKMLVLDVDGVLTDCRLWMDSNGDWKRFYCVRDGVGIKRLIECGYKIAVITGSVGKDIQARVKVLGMHFFYEGKMDKVPAFEDLQKQSAFSPSEMAYVGDDYFDIPLIESVAFGATVPEAVDEVLEAADYITRRTGGNGAVREVCDLIYKYGAFSTGRS
jgi:3-deoxy-D-manno-octulosonate 8-phosphate phosphatase (KDO 8-P phosphatase)